MIFKVLDIYIQNATCIFQKQSFCFASGTAYFGFKKDLCFRHLQITLSPHSLKTMYAIEK